MTTSFQGPLAAAFARTPGYADLLLPAASALPLAPAADRTVWGPGGSADAPALADLVARSSAERSSPWPQPRAADAARTHIDGDRTAWETPTFTRQQRLSRAAVAAAATLDRDALAEVLDGVVLLCEQTSWCWPAHDDVHARSGRVLPDTTAPFVDLGAGEVLGQLAWVDQLLGTELEARYPGVRARIRHEARLRVLDPFVARRDWHWLGLDGDVHNWNPWIHGNVLVGALRLLDGPGEEARRAHVIALAVEGLDRYVASLPADGAIDEGYAYWWNGACRALETLDLLRHATGGALDASAVPALRETVAFPHRCHLGGAWYLNVADGQARPPAAQPWRALHRAALVHDVPAARAHAAAHRTPGRPAADETEGLGRLLRAVTDDAWLAARPTGSPLPRDVVLPSVQILLARELAGSAAGLTVAAKGGHNDEHHNHDDVGSFVVASDGVPVLVDAGRPTYTRWTFGPDRYSIWTMRSGWHNVPVLAGLEQPPGARYRAERVELGASDAGARFAADLQGAYDAPPGAHWRRAVELDRTTGTVAVTDTHRGAGPCALHLIVAGEVSLGPGGARVVPLEGATPVLLSWPDGIDAVVEDRELDDPMLSSVWGPRLVRIALDVTAHPTTTITVRQEGRA